MESEFISVSDSASPVMWSRNYLIEQGYPQLPAIIYQDDTRTIDLALKGQFGSKKTEHIAVHYFFIKNYIERNDLVKYLMNQLKLLISKQDGISKKQIVISVMIKTNLI
jgi:hypothetical protein